MKEERGRRKRKKEYSKNILRLNNRYPTEYEPVVMVTLLGGTLIVIQ